MHLWGNISRTYKWHVKILRIHKQTFYVERKVLHLLIILFLFIYNLIIILNVEHVSWKCRIYIYYILLKNLKKERGRGKRENGAYKGPVSSFDSNGLTPVDSDPKKLCDMRIFSRSKMIEIEMKILSYKF